MSMNDEKMQERSVDKKALPIIYSVKVSGGSATETMHQMYVYAKAQFEKRKIKLPVSEIKAKEFLVGQYNFIKLESYDQARLIAPYANCTRLINEAINLEKEYKNGFIKLSEPPGKRKDRISSLLYGLSYVQILESKLQNELQKRDYSSLFSVSSINQSTQSKSTPFGTSYNNPFSNNHKTPFGK